MASNIQPTGLDWKNLPQKTTPISAENLNKMANTIDDLVEAVNPLNTVEANPTGTPTEGLEKVEIDGTLYEVKGGHKILNDSGTTLTQKDNLQFKGVYTQNNGDNTEVDICRTMTKAQMEALSGEALKGFINTSDEPDSLPLTTDWIETDNGDSLTDRISDIEDGIAGVEIALSKCDELLKQLDIPTTATSYNCNWKQYYFISIEHIFYDNTREQILVPTSYFNTTSSGVRVMIYDAPTQRQFEVYKNTDTSVYIKASAQNNTVGIRIYGIMKK